MSLEKKWCDYCLLSPNVIGDICRWPCSRITKHKVTIHFAKSNRISEPNRPFHEGLRSVLSRYLNTRKDIDFSFAMEKRYQTCLMKIKDFLLLEYRFQDGINQNLIRDRVWLSELVSSPEAYCSVPKTFISELSINKAFKNRCEHQNITF